MSLAEVKMLMDGVDHGNLPDGRVIGEIDANGKEVEVFEKMEDEEPICFKIHFSVSLMISLSSWDDTVLKFAAMRILRPPAYL